MDVFKSNSYFKGVNIPVPDINVREVERILYLCLSV